MDATVLYILDLYARFWDVLPRMRLDSFMWDVTHPYETCQTKKKSDATVFYILDLYARLWEVLFSLGGSRIMLRSWPADRIL